MFKYLVKVRYLAAVVVIFAVLHALAFLFMGAQVAAKTYWHLLAVESSGARPGLELLHSLDFLMIALVLVILALGVAKLFLLPSQAAADLSAALPRWLGEIETFRDLKVLLWETILFALLIIGLSNLTSALLGTLQWSALVVPVAILLLAISLFFVKKA